MPLGRCCDNVWFQNSQDLWTLEEPQVYVIQLASKSLVDDNKMGVAPVLLVGLNVAYDNICMPDGRGQVTAILLQHVLFCPAQFFQMRQDAPEWCEQPAGIAAW